MKRTSPLLLAVLFAVIAADLPSARAQTAAASPRELSYADPFMAGVLSWTMPGAGQMYARSWTKGSFFVMGEVVNKSALVFLLMYLNDQYGKKGAGPVIVNWNALRMRDKAFLAGYLLLSSGFRIYNALDAVQTANRLNLRRQVPQEEPSTGFVPGIFPDGTGGLALSMSWNRSF